MADALVLENVISNALTENFKNDERLKNIDKPESKIIETYENLAGETMKLTDVTKQVIDLCMTLIKKNDDNVNRVMEIKNPVNQISNTTNNNVTNYQSPVDKVNNIYKTNRNTNSNGLKTSTILNSIKDGVAKNINGFLGREVPFYNSIKSSFGALGKILSSRNRAEPTSPIGIGNVSKFFNSPVEDTPTGLFGKNNDSEVGISKRALAENKVLRYSTVGVAVGWLAKQLKGVGGEGDGLGMKDLIMGNAITSAGGGILSGGLGILSSLLLHPLKTLTGMGSKILKFGGILTFLINFLRRKDTETVTGKDSKDISIADRGISSVTQGIFGNSGDGSAGSRLASGAQNAIWGGVLGMRFGPWGALTGATIGAITGLIGGDKIAGGLIKAKDKLADSIVGTELTTRNLNASYKKNDESLNKTTDNLDKFNKKVKEAPTIWDMFLDKLADSIVGTELTTRNLNASYKKNDESLNKTTDNLDKFNKKVKEAPTIWDMFLDKLRNWGLLPPKPSDSGGGVPSGGVSRYTNPIRLSKDSNSIENATRLIMNNEGHGASSLNRSDNGSGFSIGSLQNNWKSGNALQYLEYISKADPDIFNKYMGNDFLAKLRDARKNKRIVTLSSAEKSQWEAMFKYDSANQGKLTNADKQFTANRVAGYIGSAEKLGITDSRLKTLFADMANQYGTGGATNKFKQAGLFNGASTDAILANLRVGLINKYGSNSHYVARFDRNLASIQSSGLGGAEQNLIVGKQKPVANKTVKSENLSETVAKQKEKEREANNEQRENVKTMAQATVEAKEIAENKNKTSAEITFAGKPSNNNFWISNSIMKTFFGGTVGGEANTTVA